MLRGAQGIDIRKAQATVAADRDRILDTIGEQLDLVNAQLKLLFLLEPYDTATAALAALPPGRLLAVDGVGDWCRTAIDNWLALSEGDDGYR